MPTAAVSILTALFSILVPQKQWYAGGQAVTVDNKGDAPITLVLTGFTGKPMPATGSADVDAGVSANLSTLFPATVTPGAYLLFALPKGAPVPDPAQPAMPKNFLGTPLVVEVLADPKSVTNTPMVTHIVPLQYAIMTADAGPITMAFFYDAAPHTVENFLDLSRDGYYNGVTFHRIIPDFMIQGGDPEGNGQGGPGYSINAEFNPHKHLEGVLSMARTNDPNSAGSQFFICLNYEHTKHLDNQYTAFGKVIDGMDAVKAIAATPLVDPRQGTPVKAPIIQKVEIFPVTADKNPYATIIMPPASDAQPPGN